MKGDIYNLCIKCQRNQEKICYCKKYIPDKQVIIYNPETRKRANAKYMSNPENRLKVYARVNTWKALKKGKIVKKNCEVCGDENTEAHHLDYRFATEKLVWLCKDHHEEVHHKKSKQLVM